MIVACRKSTVPTVRAAIPLRALNITCNFRITDVTVGGYRTPAPLSRAPPLDLVGVSAADDLAPQ